jgi:2-aminoethylphosphonate-pyruvate transaminase
MHAGWISHARRAKPARLLVQVPCMLLLIPGPVTTRPEVREALRYDFAPWDNDFRPLYAGIRERVLHIAHGVPGEHATLPLQGCGHFITEAAIRSFVSPGHKLLIPATGSYADRMIRLAREAGRIPVPLALSPVEATDPDAVAAALTADSDISHVGVVHSETGSGIVHDVAAIGAVVRRLGRRMIVDAVSAFGALPLDLSAQPEIDVVGFTSNKCLEGVPGMAFAIARIDRIEACAGNAGSWSLDLSSIYAHALRSGWGSFRFTPPAQVLNAFNVALDLFDAEGGQPARLARYTANMRTLYDGVHGLGLTPCLPSDVQGPIIVNVHAPVDPAWDLQRFVDALKTRGVLISNFYSTEQPSFRVGCIGAITPADMAVAVTAMGEALGELGIARKAA